MTFKNATVPVICGNFQTIQVVCLCDYPIFTPAYCIIAVFKKFAYTFVGQSSVTVDVFHFNLESRIHLKFLETSIRHSKAVFRDANLF